MSKFIVRLGLILLVANALFSTCDGLRSGFNRNNRGSNNPSKPKTYLGSNATNGQNISGRRGIGLSAWGIITIVLSLILTGVSLYYFSICYPMLCKKTRKYNMIGLPSAV